MTWAQALPLITNNINQGMHLDPSNQYKIVTDIPPYQCYRNGFNGLQGYRVQVGRNSIIEIPVAVLMDIHAVATYNNVNWYNKHVLQFRYGNLYDSKPCYFHTIGKIFTNSGVAIQTGRSDYQML